MPTSPSPPPPAAREGGRRIRVLFVDDEKAILEALERVLFARNDWHCAFTTSGEQALERLDQEPFDVVVSDLGLPGMDGAELLERVMQRHPATLRVAFTGYNELENALRVTPVAQQFLIKPCAPEILYQVVDRSCALRDRLRDERLRTIVGKISSLPARPRVYARLAQALRDPNASLADVARIIEEHPGLSAKVLQLVNSAFMGLRRRTTSVEEAVRYIGFQLIRGLVLSCEVFSVLVDDERSEDRLGPAHSLLTARIAAEIAEDRTQAEEAFTAGLLHDIGWLVLEREFPEAMRQARERAASEGRPLHVLEQEVVRATQAEVGGYLLGLWGIPLPIVEAVFHHREPWLVPTDQFDLPGMLHVACRLAHETHGASAATAEEIAASDAYLARVGVAERLPEWRETARSCAEEARDQAA